MSVSITSSLRVALVAGTGVTFDAPLVSLISTDDVYNPENPTETLTDVLNAISTATLLGSANVDGTTVGNTAIFTAAVGQKFIPTSILFALTAISGSGDGPSINAGVTGPAYKEYVDSTATSKFVLSGGTFFAAGSGYTPANILTLSGGTLASGGAAATVTLNAVSLASLGVNAAGIHYVPGDTVTLAGGTSATKGVVTIQTVKLVSATIAAGGSGYGNAQLFEVTIVGGTHTVLGKATVSTLADGTCDSVQSISAGGSYTVLPTLTNNAATGDNGVAHGTGLELNLVFGINTGTITTNGEYTVESATFTQFATSGTGTGATFNNALYGALGSDVTAPGDYAVVPSNHVALTGGGTGATLDATWEDTVGTFADIDTVGQIVQVTDFNGSNYMTGGEELFVRVAFASTFDVYTLKVFVFGFSFT